jgi:hypothetical protein
MSAQESALRLYHRAKRLNDGQVATVGVGKSSKGNDVLIVYFLDRAPRLYPANFEGYAVMSASAKKRQ